MDFSVLQNDVMYLLWGIFPDGPLAGAALSLSMGVGAGVLALLLGIIGGIVHALNEHNVLGRCLGVSFAILRSIPVIMLFFWTFFLLPVVLGVHVPAVGTVVISLALIYGAYVAQVVRAGLSAIGVGQWSAGLSLGLSRWQTLRYITLPQGLRVMIPSLVNQGVALMKDTSLAYILSVSELTMLINQVNGRLMVYPMEVFLLGGLIYLMMCGPLEILGVVLQKKLKND